MSFHSFFFDTNSKSHNWSTNRLTSTTGCEPGLRQDSPVTLLSTSKRRGLHQIVRITKSNETIIEQHTAHMHDMTTYFESSLNVVVPARTKKNAPTESLFCVRYLCTTPCTPMVLFSSSNECASKTVVQAQQIVGNLARNCRARKTCFKVTISEQGDVKSPAPPHDPPGP